MNPADILPCPKCKPGNVGHVLSSDIRTGMCLDCGTEWQLGVSSPEPSGTILTLHTADPFEALEWAERELEKRRLALDWSVSRLCVKGRWG